MIWGAATAAILLMISTENVEPAEQIYLDDGVTPLNLDDNTTPLKTDGSP